MRIIRAFLAYILLALFILVVVLAVSWHLGEHHWGDLSSRGQLLVDVLLLPAAILGFLLAMEEFRKAQEIPDLDLYWIADGSQCTKVAVTGEKPEHGNRMWPLSVAVVNSGRAVCNWFMLELTVPGKLSQYYREGGVDLVRIVGGDDNWRTALRNDGREGFLFTFMSNGQIAAYPRYPLILGKVRVFLLSDRTYDNAFEVPYKIASDRGKPKEGRLIIRVP